METAQEITQITESSVYPKKRVKSDVNRAALATILNLLIMNIVVIGYVVARMVFVYVVEMLKANQNIEQAEAVANEILNSDAFLDSVVESGTPYLISIFFGILFVGLIMNSKAPVKNLFKTSSKMDLEAFLMCLCVFMSIQIPISLLDAGIEACLNVFGYTAQAGIEMATAGSTTVTMFLYASFGAPIAEEVIYRGFVMKSLEKYGKTFAIVVAAIMFGLMHTNLTQSIFAMFVGLVLGYVAMEYSLKWAIILHAINNCLFGELMTFALKGLDEKLQDTIELGVLGAFCIAGIGVLIAKRNEIIQYVKEHSGAKEHYKFAFTSVWFLVFIIGCSLAGLLVIQKL